MFCVVCLRIGLTRTYVYRSRSWHTACNLDDLYLRFHFSFQPTSCHRPFYTESTTHPRCICFHFSSIFVASFLLASICFVSCGFPEASRSRGGVFVSSLVYMLVRWSTGYPFVIIAALSFKHNITSFETRIHRWIYIDHGTIATGSTRLSSRVRMRSSVHHVHMRDQPCGAGVRLRFSGTGICTWWPRARMPYRCVKRGSRMTHVTRARAAESSKQYKR